MVPILIAARSLGGGFRRLLGRGRARCPGRSGTTGPSSTPTSAASSRRRRRSAAHRFPVKYFLTAMLFIVFDIEIIFLYPWAVAFNSARHVRPGRDDPVHRHRVRRRTPTSGAAAGSSGTDLNGYRGEAPRRDPADHASRSSLNWHAQVLALAGAVRSGLLRHRDDGVRRAALRHRPVRHGGVQRLAAAGRPDDRRRPGQPEDGAGAAPDLRPDARAQVGARDGRLREQRRHVQQLRDRAGRRPRRPGRHVPAGLPASPRDAARRDPQAAREDQHGPISGKPEPTVDRQLAVPEADRARHPRLQGPAGRRRDRAARPRRCPGDVPDQAPSRCTEPTRSSRPSRRRADGIGGPARHVRRIRLRRHLRLRRPGGPRAAAGRRPREPYGEWFDEATDALARRYPGFAGRDRARSSSHRGELTLHVEREALLEVCQHAARRPGAAVRDVRRACPASTTSATRPVAGCTRSTTCCR